MTIILLSILIITSLLYFKKPRHNRDWRPEQSKLPNAIVDGDKILIHNIRNCSYKSESDFELNYYDKEFDLKKIKSIDLVIQPFKKMPLAAHLFLSFGFEGGDYVSVSIEARRKKIKKNKGIWSVIKPFEALYILFFGFFKSFELIYIIADEGDIMRLRPLYHKDNVFIYPLNIKKIKIKKIFLDILNRVNKIEQKSEFYNTLTNSCVTNLFNHIKNSGEVNIPRSWKFYFPSTIDKLVYDIKLIKTKLGFHELRDRHLINKKAEEHKDDPDYSLKIRG